MKNKFINTIQEHFPSSKQQWKKFTLTSLPIIFSSIVFALNAFVDNFMSTNIEGGNQALSYANTWTEIEVGIIGLTTLIGSSLFAQFLGKQDFLKLKEVINCRLIFAIGIALFFAIPSWIVPWDMVSLISGFDKNMLNIVHIYATDYLRLITISWILNAIWFTMSMILREKHHGLVSFFSSLISLITNIVLNSIFIFGLNLGIEFLAYSTIISNVLALIFVFSFIVIKDKHLGVNPLKIFQISKHIWKLFFKRSFAFVFLAIGSIAVTVRFVIWNIGFPTGSIGNPLFVISAANILGISGMFFNIFWTAFDSVNANVSIYVGKELGANNFDTAKLHAKQLLGFHLVVAVIISLLLFICSFGIEQMRFLANGYKEGLISHLEQIYYQGNINEIVNEAVNDFMENLKFTLWPLCLFIPMFIWFITKSRIISAGGYTNVVALVEAIAGILQLGWLAIICLLISNPQNAMSFPLAYFLFFLADIPKLIVYEILYKKINWVKNIID